MEDEILIDDSDSTIQELADEGFDKSTTIDGLVDRKSNTNTGELLTKLRRFQNKIRSNPLRRPHANAQSIDKQVHGKGSSRLISIRASGSVSATLSWKRPETPEEIVAELESKVKAIMQENPDEEMDVVKLVRKDVNARFTHDDVKKITRRLVKKITKDEVV